MCATFFFLIQLPTELQIAMFQSTQKYLGILGISSTHTIQKRPINTRSLMILLLCSFFIISSALYLFYVPNSFDEYIAAVNISLTAIVNTIYLVVFFWKTPKLFSLINSTENLFQMGKLKSGAHLKEN